MYVGVMPSFGSTSIQRICSVYVDVLPSFGSIQRTCTVYVDVLPSFGSIQRKCTVYVDVLPSFGSIPVKSPVFNRSLLFFGLHFTCLLFFSCFFLVSCFSPVFLENQSKATIISYFSSSSAQIYLNSYSLACNSALLACLNNTQLT